MERPIKTEDDFLFALYQIKKSEVFLKAWPKITSIPKGTKITPDIDLLTIERVSGKPPLVTGYELKLLTRKDPFAHFYTGLGEVIHYFQYGVDRAYLVIGCHILPSNIAERVEEKLKATSTFLKQTFLGCTPHVGIRLHRQGIGSYDELVKVERDFPVSSYEEPKHKRECLLREEFGWGQKWLKNREKALPTTQ